MINPYDFMGLTIASSVADLRKAYYSMSLACHPDKGGSAEAMIILQTAYKWIKSQLDNIEKQPDAGKDYEQIQKEFDDYIKAQDAMKPSSLLNVLAETLEITKADYMDIYDRVKTPNIPAIIMYDIMICALNEELRNNHNDVDKVTKENVLKRIEIDLKKSSEDNISGIYHSSIPHGYGDLMEDSSFLLGAHGNAGTPLKYPFEKRSMVNYKEPSSYFLANRNVSEMNLPDKKEDYTIHDSKLPITDYKFAYSETDNSSIFDSLFSTEPIDILLAAKRIEREL